MSGGGGSSLQKSRGKKEAVGEACIIPWGNSAILGSGCGGEVGMGEAEVPGEAAMGSREQRDLRGPLARRGSR